MPGLSQKTSHGGEFLTEEGDLKKAVIDYLQYKQNQGALYWERLNSGAAFKWNGKKFYRIQLCREGTSDLEVLSNGVTYFLELKSKKGKPTEVQRLFRDQVEAQGARYLVIRDVAEVMELFGGEQ
jgi:hypothetical protein